MISTRMEKAYRRNPKMTELPLETRQGEYVVYNNEFSGTVRFSVSTGLVPWDDPGQFVHRITGEACDLEESGVGKIACKLVSIAEVMNQKEDLLEVCDADSMTLEGLYWALFDGDGNTREELEIEPAWNDLLFIERISVAEEYADTSLRVQLIETSIAIFAPEGLIAAEEESLDLSIEEWRRLGFKRIAESEYVLREQTLVNPYEKESDGEA